MATPSKSANPFYINDDLNDGWDDWGDDEEEQQSLVYNKYDHSKAGGSTRPTQTQAYEYQPPPIQKHVSPVENQEFLIPKYAKGALLGSLAVLFLIAMSGGNGNESIINKGMAQVPSDEITHLVILGERHSGVPLLESELKKCYPDAQVSSSLERIGIFFQDDPSSQKHNSVVLQLVLNPYDWFEQMRHNPLYMPEHEGEDGEPMPWFEFLTKKWSTERPERDLKYKNSTGPVCQMSFHYNQVISCVEGEGTKNPIYELNEYGDSFDNIIELRAAKLMNHRATKDWETVKDHFIVQNEKLNDEYEGLLDKIDAATGWVHTCDKPKIFPTQSHTKTMSLEYLGQVASSLDWELESEFGYKIWEDEIEIYQIGLEGNKEHWDDEDEDEKNLDNDTDEDDDEDETSDAEGDEDEDDDADEDEDDDGDEDEDDDGDEDGDEAETSDADADAEGDEDEDGDGDEDEDDEEASDADEAETAKADEDADGDGDEKDGDEDEDGDETETAKADEDADGDGEEKDGDKDEDGDETETAKADEDADGDGDEKDGNETETATADEDADGDGDEKDGDETETAKADEDADGDGDEKDGDETETAKADEDEKDGDETETAKADEDADGDGDEKDGDETETATADEDADGDGDEKDGDKDEDGDEKDGDDDDAVAEGDEDKDADEDTGEDKDSDKDEGADEDEDDTKKAAKTTKTSGSKAKGTKKNAKTKEDNR